MSAGAQVDYDELARQHGGQPAAAAPPASGGVDYDALAQQHGGKVAAPGSEYTEHPETALEKGQKSKQGFIGALGSDLASMGKAAIPAMLPPVQAYQGIKRGIQEFTDHTSQKEAERRQSEGYSPTYSRVLAPLGESLGMNVRGTEEAAAKGDTAGVIGHAAAPLAVTVGAEMGARAIPKVARMAQATGDPNVLYRSYLDPVMDSPSPRIPDVTPNVRRAVLREVDTLNPEAGARIRRGEATLGDKDLMRMRANKLSQTIYRSPGNYPAAMAEGAADFASRLREDIYPQIERAHGLDAGSMQPIKRLQGAEMNAERNPSFFRRFARGAGGALIGAPVGYEIGGPAGAYAGGAVGAAVGDVAARGLERGGINLRTRALASRMPEPGIVPRLALPAPRMMGSIPADEPSAPSFHEGTNLGTRAERKGLLLPEGKTGMAERTRGGQIPLDSRMEPLEPTSVEPPPIARGTTEQRKRLGLHRGERGTGTGY